MLNRPSGLFPDKEAFNIGKLSNEILYNGSGTNPYQLLGTGNIGGNNSYKTTTYISIEGNRPYRLKNWASPQNVIGSSYYYLYAAFYDVNKVLIGRAGSKSGTLSEDSYPTTNANGDIIQDVLYTYNSIDTCYYFVTPENTAYIRIVHESSKTVTLYDEARYSNNLTLSAQVQNGSSIETWVDDNGITRACCTLILWDNDNYIHFCFDKENNTDYAPRVIENGVGKSIKFDLPVSDMIDITGKYLSDKISSLPSLVSVSLYDCVRPGKNLSWKIRLYGKNSVIDKENNTYYPSTTIAYGTISAKAVVQEKISSSTYKNIGYRYTIFPHVGIYDDIIDRLGSTYHNDVIDKNGNNLTKYPNIKKTCYDILKNYDDKIRYWLVSDGYSLEFLQYRLYPVDKMGEPAASLIYSKHFDGYGNPLNGYAVIALDELNNVLGSSSYDYSKIVNRPYHIDTNYIDSKWGYFEVYNDADITITDNVGNVITEEEFNLTYSALRLAISFVQSQGIGINYYSYKVYAQSDGKWELEYASGNFYNQDAKISYDRFFAQKHYKIAITIIDTNQSVYEREVYAYTNFPESTSPIIADVSYYKPHNSVIVDWSSVNSTLPSQIVNASEIKYGHIEDRQNESGINNGYEFATETNDVNQKKAIYIPSKSSLLYNKHDLGNKLCFTNSTLIMDFYGTDITGYYSENNEILHWKTSDGFEASVRYTNNDSLKIITNKYGYEYQMYLYDENQAYSYQLYKELGNRPYNRPYIWDSSLTWDNGYVWNTENNIAVKWRIIITPASCKLLCLYDGYYDATLSKGNAIDEVLFD